MKDFSPNVKTVHVYRKKPDRASHPVYFSLSVERDPSSSQYAPPCSKHCRLANSRCLNHGEDSVAEIFVVRSLFEGCGRA